MNVKASFRNKILHEVFIAFLAALFLQSLITFWPDKSELKWLLSSASTNFSQTILPYTPPAPVSAGGGIIIFPKYVGIKMPKSELVPPSVPEKKEIIKTLALLFLKEEAPPSEGPPTALPGEAPAAKPPIAKPPITPPLEGPPANPPIAKPPTAKLPTVGILTGKVLVPKEEFLTKIIYGVIFNIEKLFEKGFLAPKIAPKGFEKAAPGYLKDITYPVLRFILGILFYMGIYFIVFILIYLLAAYLPIWPRRRFHRR